MKKATTRDFYKRREQLSAAAHRETGGGDTRRAERGGVDPNLSPPQSLSPPYVAAILLIYILTMLAVHQRKSILELAEDSGLFDINPSDLVYESSSKRICYYDFVLSVRRCPPAEGNGKMLYLAKFDECVNLEVFETAHILPELFEDGLPQSDLGLMTLGVLIWKHVIAKSRVLCLIRQAEVDNNQPMEALKRATYKFSVLHHVQTVQGPRRVSLSSNSSFGSNHSYHAEGMRMKVLLCQSRSQVEHIPAQAVRETKALLNPASNPILCLCFPIV